MLVSSVVSLLICSVCSRYRASPILILDEVDAALDNVNVKRVAQFLSNHKSDFQSIAVSLRLEYFGETDGLIGITRNVSSSNAYHVEHEIWPSDNFL